MFSEILITAEGQHGSSAGAEACQVEWCDAAAEPADSRHHPPGGLGEI